MDMSPEDIQTAYNAAMDSVNLVNGPKPANMNDADWAECVSRNVRHLEIMVSKDCWEGHDMTPLTDAIAANR